MILNETYLIGSQRRFRESGEAIIITDQSIFNVHSVVKGNLHTIICLGQRDTKDMRESIEILSLNPQQAELINILEVGQGIVRLAARYPHPVRLNFPLVEPINITDQEIDEINSKDNILNFLVSQIKLRRDPPGQAPKSEHDEKTEPEKCQEYSGKIKKELKKLSETIAHNPYKVSTMIMKKAGFSGSKGNRIKAYAKEKGYILEHKISLGIRGGASIFLELTSKGYEMLDEVLVEYQRPKGKGNFEHRFYQYLVACFYTNKGFQVDMEQQEYLCSSDQGNLYTLADVGVKDNEKSNIAVEIELNVNAQIVKNIERDLKAGFDRVIVVTRKDLFEAVKNRIDNLPENIRQKAELRPISAFF